jgi:uncharacterized protein (DUF305 family)
VTNGPDSAPLHRHSGQQARRPKNPEVSQLADSIISAQERGIKQMQQVLARLK